MMAISYNGEINILLIGLRRGLRIEAAYNANADENERKMVLPLSKLYADVIKDE